MRFALFYILTASAAASALCPHELLRLSFQFGNAYDAYVAATVPNLNDLRKKRWVLTGVANQKSSPFVWGTAYEPTGYEVDRRVPELEFFTRDEAVSHEGTAAVAIYGQADHYVFRKNWGPENKVKLPGVAAHVPTHWTSYPALKRESVTWGFQLFGKDQDLFVSQKTVKLSSSQLQLYCRMSQGGLLCMGELFLKSSETLQPKQISLYLLFEPAAPR